MSLITFALDTFLFITISFALLYAMMGQNDQAKANLKRVVELGVRNPVTENLQRILQNPPPEVIK